MLYFLEKAGKSSQRWGLHSQPPLAFGGWELCPQTPEWLFLLNLRLNF